jgi:APA family basic amino acid/polyamine antiporter
MRKKQPDAPRAFKTPWVPVIPIMGICFCLFLMVSLPFDTWIRLVIWMLIGHNIYVFYGSRKSVLGAKKGVKLLSVIGVGIALFLLSLLVLHQWQVGWDKANYYTWFLFIIALFHIVMYGQRITKEVLLFTIYYYLLLF